MYIFRNAYGEKIRKIGEIKKLTNCVVELDALGLNGCLEVIDKSFGLNGVKK